MGKFEPVKCFARKSVYFKSSAPDAMPFPFLSITEAGPFTPKPNSLLVPLVRGHEWVCVPKQKSLRTRLDAALTPEQVKRLREAVVRKPSKAKRKGTRKEASK